MAAAVAAAEAAIAAPVAAGQQWWLADCSLTAENYARAWSADHSPDCQFENWTVMPR